MVKLIDIDPSWSKAQTQAVLEVCLLAWKRLDDLKASRSSRAIFRVLFQLRHHIGHHEETNRARLCELTNFKERQVQYALAWLKRNRFIFEGKGGVLLLEPAYLAPIWASKKPSAPPLCRGAKDCTPGTIRTFHAPPSEDHGRKPYSEPAARREQETATATAGKERGGWIQPRQLVRGILADLAPPGRA